MNDFEDQLKADFEKAFKEAVSLGVSVTGIWYSIVCPRCSHIVQVTDHVVIGTAVFQCWNCGASAVREQ
jgi:hypothetical protein